MNRLATFQNNLVYATVGGLFYMYREEVKEGLLNCLTFLKNRATSQIAISLRVSPKGFFAIKKELNAAIYKYSQYVSEDGVDCPEYDIPNGIYFPNYWVICYVEQDIITLYSFARIETLKTYYEDVYKMHSQPIITYFISNGREWEHPSFSRKRVIPKITTEMKDILNDVELFYNSEDIYKKEGRPFRRGYLFHGDPGTGKSTLIEMIAGFRNLSVYRLNLSDINDSDLAILFNKVPPFSIIVIEEVDDKLDNLREKSPYGTTTTVSIGGLKDAIDGCKRMPHGSLFVMTANDKDKISTSNALYRKGRIDVVKKFTTKFGD